MSNLTTGIDATYTQRTPVKTGAAKRKPASRSKAHQTSLTNRSNTEAAKTRILALLDDNKAHDVVTIDLAGKTSIADYMIIASGTSQRHVQALATKLSDLLKEVELYYIPPEGMENCDWVVVDAGDIVIHIFRPEMREVYNLEKMWSVALPVAELEIVD